MDFAAMKQVDVHAIDRSALRQRNSVKIDPDAPQSEKVKALFSQINPYCYLDGKTVVINRFAQTEVSITDCYCAYLSGV